MIRDSNGDLCSGWKQIAAHLGISVRTAQMWEKERGLPVHRSGDFERGPVVAFPEELDAWQGTQFGNLQSREYVAGVSFRWIAGVVVAALLLGYSAYRFWPVSQDPALAGFRGEILQVFNQSGQLLWERSIPGFSRTRYGLAVDGAPVSSAEWLLIANLDDDPQKEVLISQRPKERTGRSDSLLALDDGGETLWEQYLDFPLEAGGRRFYRFTPKPIGLGNGFVVVFAEGDPFYPCQVALLDPKSGEIVDRYLHPGYLHATLWADLDGDGSEELIFGGVNNPGEGPGRPVVGVLKVPFRKKPPHPKDFFHNVVQVEKYLVFELPDLKRRLNQIAPAALRLLDSGGFIEAMISPPGPLYFSLGPALEPLSFDVSDEFLQLHTQMYFDGKLDHAFDDAEADRLGRVLYLDYAPDGNSPELDQLFETQAISLERRAGRKDVGSE